MGISWALGVLLPGWEVWWPVSLLQAVGRGLSQGGDSRAVAALVLPAEESAWRCL